MLILLKYIYNLLINFWLVLSLIVNNLFTLLFNFLLSIIYFSLAKYGPFTRRLPHRQICLRHSTVAPDTFLERVSAQTFLDQCCLNAEPKYRWFWMVHWGCHCVECKQNAFFLVVSHCHIDLTCANIPSHIVSKLFSSSYLWVSSHN